MDEKLSRAMCEILRMDRPLSRAFRESVALEIERLRALTPPPASGLMYRATCGVCGTEWEREASEPPKPCFCPDCQERKLTAPGVLTWMPPASGEVEGDDEPDDAMIEAGEEVIETARRHCVSVRAADVYRAMREAASLSKF